MTGLSTLARTPVRAFALTLFLALSLAPASEGSCLLKGPVRYLWIEVVSCSDTALQEVSEELLRPVLGGIDADFVGETKRYAAELFRETPGLLIVAHELAFADSEAPFTDFDPAGKFATRVSDRIGEWRKPEAASERRYFLGSAQARCESLQAAKPIVVYEQSTCCDTGRSGAIGCILEVPELRSSKKAPPTDAELSAAGVTPTPSPAAPEGTTGGPKPF